MTSRGRLALTALAEDALNVVLMNLAVANIDVQTAAQQVHGGNAVFLPSTNLG